MSYEIAYHTHTLTLTHTHLINAVASWVSDHKSKDVCIYILHCLIRNDLPISNRAFLFVNNSLHPRAKGVFRRESNQDDYVASYCNTGSLHLIAMVWLYCGFTACCAQSCTTNSPIYDAQLCSNFPANLYQVFLIGPVTSV